MKKRINMELVIIGSGNVATVLGRKALSAGHRILQVVSRDASRAGRLGAELGAASGSLEDLDTSALFYIMAVPDDALPELASSLHLGRAVVVHTAGSVSKHVLNRVSWNYGVLWPLQSMRRERTGIPGFPLIIDASTPESLTLIRDLAGTLSEEVRIMDDDQRRKMHLAAVISGNFSNRLFAMVKAYCGREGLDYSLLLPMLEETVARLGREDPSDMQTGPAIRNDMDTMARHMDMLQHDEDLLEIYRIFSMLIRKGRPGEKVSELDR